MSELNETTSGNTAIPPMVHEAWQNAMIHGSDTELGKANRKIIADHFGDEADNQLTLLEDLRETVIEIRESNRPASP